MRVLVLTPWYPTAKNPVTGVFVREHSKAAQLYDDITVVHLMSADSTLRGLWHLKEETEHELTAGLRTYRLHCRHPIPYSGLLLQCWGCYRAIQQLSRVGLRPDVLHAHIFTAGLAAVISGRLLGIPVVITEHSTAFPMHSLQVDFGRFAIRMAKWSMLCAAKVLPVSHALQRAIESYGIRARFQVVPNVVDTELFFPLPRSRELSTNKRLLFVGLLDPSHKKGLPHLLGALAKVRCRREDWEIEVVGDGEAREEYERLVTDLCIADKVRFLGYKAKPEIAEIMRRADLFVLSSVFETFSVVTIEAMASGLPVVVTRCGGPEEYVTEAIGKVVPKGDTDALAAAIIEMLDRLGEYSPQAIRCYVAERFSYEHVGRILHDIYSEVRKNA